MAEILRVETLEYKCIMRFEYKISYEDAKELLIEAFDNQMPLFKSSVFYKSQYKELDCYGIFLENLQLITMTLDKSQLLMLKNLKENNPKIIVEQDERVYYKDLNPDCTSEPNNWGIRKIGAENLVLKGEGVNVAILDSGIDLSNFPIPLDKTENFAYPGDPVNDIFGHGTHVTGIISGRKIEGLQFGIAPDASIYIGKVLNDEGKFRDDSWVLEGIEWAIKKNCKIINLSLGKTVRENQSIDSYFQDVINKANELKIIIIAAIGNESSRNTSVSRYKPINSPANSKNTIAVSAVDSNDGIYIKANRTINTGQKIDFIGPGVHIFSSFPMSCSPKGYAFLDGTSMACAFISGIATLYSQVDNNLDHDKMIEKLENHMAPIKINTIDSGLGLPIIKLN